MSVLYSGTGALKTDFTRTGKRSFAGKLEDGKRSVNRYFLGNFEDTYNQNSLDFLLGKVGWNQIANNSGVEGKGILLKFLAVSYHSLSKQALRDIYSILKDPFLIFFTF